MTGHYRLSGHAPSGSTDNQLATQSLGPANAAPRQTLVLIEMALAYCDGGGSLQYTKPKA